MQMPVDIVAAILVARTRTVPDNIFPHEILFDEAVEMAVDGSFTYCGALPFKRFRDLFRSQMAVLVFDEHFQNHLALFGPVTVCLTDANHSSI